MNTTSHTPRQPFQDFGTEQACVIGVSTFPLRRPLSGSERAELHQILGQLRFDLLVGRGWLLLEVEKDGRKKQARIEYGKDEEGIIKIVLRLVD